jgi:hypothetical protein
MDVYEASTHSFVIRIWREWLDSERRQAVWRGQITHVASGERRIVRDHAEIVAFLDRYIDQLLAPPP